MGRARGAEAELQRSEAEGHMGRKGGRESEAGIRGRGAEDRDRGRGAEAEGQRTEAEADRGMQRQWRLR